MSAKTNNPVLTKIEKSFYDVAGTIPYPEKSPELRPVILAIQLEIERLHQRLNNLRGLDSETVITVSGTDYKFVNGILREVV